MAGVLAGCGQTQKEAKCPPFLDKATRLILVTTQTFESSAAKLTTFERSSGRQGWQRGPIHQAAVVGRNGVGWGHPLRHLATDSEPIKQEGDKRAPAGIFRLGEAFGLGDGLRADAIGLNPNEHVCVDDLRSEHYNRIVPRTTAGISTSGEEMWKISLYRRGLIIDYPTDRNAASGSCIFIHVWKAPDAPTSGCVALAEAAVQRLQDWAAGHNAAIAILPRPAITKFSQCLPRI